MQIFLSVVGVALLVCHSVYVLLALITLEDSPARIREALSERWSSDNPPYLITYQCADRSETAESYTYGGMLERIRAIANRDGVNPFTIRAFQHGRELDVINLRRVNGEVRSFSLRDSTGVTAIYES